MAKKRDLKQTINYVCSDLFAEGVAASLYGTANNEEAVNNLLSSIIVTRNDFVKRVSHPEPGMTHASITVSSSLTSTSGSTRLSTRLEL